MFDTLFHIIFFKCNDTERKKQLLIGGNLEHTFLGAAHVLHIAVQPSQFCKLKANKPSILRGRKKMLQMLLNGRKSWLSSPRFSSR